MNHFNRVTLRRSLQGLLLSSQWLVLVFVLIHLLIHSHSIHPYSKLAGGFFGFCYLFLVSLANFCSNLLSEVLASLKCGKILKRNFADSKLL